MTEDLRVGSRNGEGLGGVWGVAESNSQDKREASSGMSTHICVLLGWTFPAAEMEEGYWIKSGTIPFRYKRNDSIIRAITHVIE